MPYLTLSQYKLKSVIPSSYADEIDADEPGWVLGQLGDWSRWIDARLRKRYSAPFSEPYPDMVGVWLARIMDRECLLKRGVDPSDRQFGTLAERAQAAIDEIMEAANAVDGLFDLPLLGGGSSTGISRGGPLGYSEQSPYVAFDQQRDTGRNEDLFGRGTGD